MHWLPYKEYSNSDILQNFNNYTFSTMALTTMLNLRQDLHSMYQSQVDQLDAKGGAGVDVLERKVMVTEDYVKKLSTQFDSCIDILSETTRSKIDLESKFFQLERKASFPTFKSQLLSKRNVSVGDIVSSPQWKSFMEEDEPIKCKSVQLHQRANETNSPMFPSPSASNDCVIQIKQSCTSELDTEHFTSFNLQCDDISNARLSALVIGDTESNILQKQKTMSPLDIFIDSNIDQCVMDEHKLDPIVPMNSPPSYTFSKKNDSCLNDIVLNEPSCEHHVLNTAMIPTDLSNIHVKMEQVNNEIKTLYSENELLQPPATPEVQSAPCPTEHDSCEQATYKETDTSMNNAEPECEPKDPCVCNLEQERFIEMCGCELTNACRIATVQHKKIGLLADRERCLENLVMEKDIELEQRTEQIKRLECYLANSNEEVNCLRLKLRSVARECADLDTQLKMVARNRKESRNQSVPYN